MSPQEPRRTNDLRGAQPAQDLDANSGRGGQDAMNPAPVTGRDVPRTVDSAANRGKGGSGSILPAIPGYTIEGEIGRGGMGVVYRAWHTELHRPVAIKMILGGKYTDPVAQARFQIEAEVIAAIQHPNVIQVFEFGRHDDQPYFVLELVGGGSLADRQEAAGPLAPKEAAALVAKLADGMAAAHEKGVVHRDLKPGNVLLTESGEPKITDFGLAKMGESDMTASGVIVGTPSYMSPEQAAGKRREVGTLTDVYALGAILYELMTGRRLFGGASVMETIYQVLNHEPSRPRTIDVRIPRDLETICLKCLEKDARKRYATTSELAADLRAFLAGWPIAARPIGLPERTWKWAKRNPARSAGIAAGFCLLLAATVAGLVIRQQVIASQKVIHASGLVPRLLDANTADVPTIVKDMEPYRRWTDPLLREAFDKPDATPRQKLHASLALLPVDPSQVDYLSGRLLQAEPQHEVLVVRDALAPYQDGLREMLWVVVEKPEKGKEAQRLRAAAALAKFNPESDRWARASPLVVEDLVREYAIFLGPWSEAFRPVKDSFLGPLGDIFQNRNPERTAERSLATDLLADYAADNLPVLADHLMKADEGQFRVIYEKFEKHGEKGLPLLTEVIDRQPSADWPSSDERRETLAKRQANAAVALFRLNQPGKVWPLLTHSPDPRVRSYLIHRLGPMRANPQTIIHRFEEESDVTVRRALLLSLGEFGPKELPADERLAMVPKVQDIYKGDADPGLHAAAEWLLRKWDQEAWLAQINQRWAKASRSIVVSGTKPQWHVNSQGRTFVVIPGPVQFLMGAPKSDPLRQGFEPPHRQRIDRSFAIAAKSVTLGEYRQFRDPAWDTAHTPTVDCPVVGQGWSGGAEYCNWLSSQEGIAENQWCYEVQGGVIKLKLGYLNLSGYRLPTESELEYATRAGAATCRYYGESEELLPKYGWYLKNSQLRTWPGGLLKPNDLGLFDTHGNVQNWCTERFRPELQADERVVYEDRDDEREVVPTVPRIFRGGSFLQAGKDLRSAARGYMEPTTRLSIFGFRVAKTIPR